MLCNTIFNLFAPPSNSSGTSFPFLLCCSIFNSHISINDVTFLFFIFSSFYSHLTFDVSSSSIVAPPKVNLSGNRPTSRRHTHTFTGHPPPTVRHSRSCRDSITLYQSTANCHHEADATCTRHHHILSLLALLEIYTALRNSFYFPYFWGWAEFPIKINSKQLKTRSSSYYQ